MWSRVGSRRACPVSCQLQPQGAVPSAPPLRPACRTNISALECLAVGGSRVGVACAGHVAADRHARRHHAACKGLGVRACRAAWDGACMLACLAHVHRLTGKVANAGRPTSERRIPGVWWLPSAAAELLSACSTRQFKSGHGANAYQRPPPCGGRLGCTRPRPRLDQRLYCIPAVTPAHLHAAPEPGRCSQGGRR